MEPQLQAIFGFPSFRGNQKAIIEATLAGQHTLVVMPTGMGKSVCYQMSARLLGGTTLVLSPLIALMKDQVDAAKKRGFRCAYINSSLTGEERQRRYRQLAEGKFELVYVTPERFQKKAFLEAIEKINIPLLAIDEAHCVSQWGHDFRPDYTRIAEFRKTLRNPITMAVTATATQEVQDDILTQAGLQTETVQRFIDGIERPNLHVSVTDLHSLEAKYEAFTRFRNQNKGSAILYFSLIDTLERFSTLLRKQKKPHLVYHGRLSDRERKWNQDQFMKNDSDLILATPAFGLGVDKPNIRSVVHAELPGSIEAFYQEIGRAGRDGKPAPTLLLYDADDIAAQMEFIKWANPDPAFIRNVYQLIDQNRDRARAEGYDFLRAELNFYHRRDFRVETAVNLLQRWGCVEGTMEQKNIETVEPPPEMDASAYAIRLKGQQKKLLSMVELAKSDTCRKQRIYAYFGQPSKNPCGQCDRCR